MDKKKIRYVLLLAMVPCAFELVQAQKANPYFRKADHLYKDSSYAEAEEAYRKGLVHEGEGFKGSYNIANCLYQQGRADEASNYYQNSLKFSNTSKVDQSKAQYNLGNAYFQQQQFDKSVEAYREALKLNPKDNDARNNLVLARQQLIRQQQQQQQSNQNQNKNQDQNKDQPQTQNQEQKNQDQGQSKQKENKTQAEQTQDQQEQGSNSKLNKEQAEQIMRMINAQDEKIRQRIQKAQSRSPKREKDW